MTKPNGPKRGKELALAQRAAQRERDRENHENQRGAQETDDSDGSDEETQSFLPNSQPAPKKKRRSPVTSDNLDSDQEPERPPLADRVHQKRRERLEEHGGTMVKSGSSGTNKKRKIVKKAASKQRKRDDEDSDSEGKQQNGEEMSKEEIDNYRAKMRLHAINIAKNQVVSESMEAQVKKVTKKELWKMTKFFKNDGYLRKGTNFVMQKLELAELQDLPLKERIKKEEIWKEVHAPIVREAMNKHRNYVCGEIQKVVYEALKTDKTADFPNKKQVKQLMLRDCLDADTEEAVRVDMEAKFVVCVNDLLPKVAGNKYWGPSTRHYYLPSNAKHDIFVPEGCDFKDYVEAVSASDEAFLALVFENSYDKWKEQAEKFKESVEAKKADPTKELFVPKTDKTEYNLPYTNSKSGNLKYGGWLPEGIKKYGSYVKKIAKNRTDNMEYIKQVEEDALVKIQKKEGIINEEDNDPKSKKPKGKSNAAFADEDAGDEDDFGSW